MNLPNFKELASGVIKGGISGITDLVRTWKLPPEKAGEFDIQKQTLIQQVTLKGMELEQQILTAAADMEKAYLADVQSARAMQVEALRQNDQFSKRFIYYLTIILVVFCFAFDMTFFWVQYPERNHDIVNMVAGVINTVCLASVISYFFGSSKGSKDANDALRSHLTKQVPAIEGNNNTIEGNNVSQV